MTLYIVNEIAKDDYLDTFLNLDQEVFGTREQAEEYIKCEIESKEGVEGYTTTTDSYVNDDKDNYYYLDSENLNGERTEFTITTKHIMVNVEVA